MIIRTTNKEVVICGKKLVETTETKWVEATEGKLTLNSPKKIISNGNKQ